MLRNEHESVQRMNSLSDRIQNRKQKKKDRKKMKMKKQTSKNKQMFLFLSGTFNEIGVSVEILNFRWYFILRIREKRRENIYTHYLCDTVSSL